MAETREVRPYTLHLIKRNVQLVVRELIVQLRVHLDASKFRHTGAGAPRDPGASLPAKGLSKAREVTFPQN